jgi:hypothetical protein
LRIRQEEELPVYERLGDVRSKAVTMGQIADILQARGQLDEALRIRQEEQLPVYERLGDVRSLLITQVQIGILFMQFNPPRRAEANQLLCEALHAAQQMRIPEAGQIRMILQDFEMQCENDEGISVEEILQIVFSELSRLPEEQRADAFNAFLSQFPDEIKEAILQFLNKN